jgi:hypothetical protein
MDGTCWENVADFMVFEYIRMGVLRSRAAFAGMSPQERAESTKEWGGYEEDLGLALAVLPTVEELRSKYEPEILVKVYEEMEECREEQARKLVSGFGDKGRKDFEDSLTVRLFHEMSRVPSPRTGKAKSRRELVHDLSELRHVDERTVRRLLANERMIRPTVDFSFNTSQRKAKHRVL